MPSASVLDISELVQPIPGASPAGVPCPYEVRVKLEELRKEIDPADYDEDDPRRPKEYRKADWAGVVQLASDTLQKKSKDLLLGVRLVEAVTIERGFAGLRDGVELLRQLVEQAWDRMHPLIAEGETPEPREGAFKWLNQNGYGAMFPRTVRQTAFISTAGRVFNYFDWQQPATRHAFDAAFASLTVENAQEIFDDLKACKESLSALDSLLHEKMGEFAPDLTSSENTEHLGAAVNDCLRLAQQLLQRKIGVPTSAEDTPMDGPSADGAPVTRVLATRADAYRMLNQAADMLQQIEPHSPIPYLIKRAVRLGEMKFPDLMKALLRENTALDELYRLTGVEGEIPPSPQSDSE